MVPSAESFKLTPKASYDSSGVLWGYVDAEPAPAYWACSLTDP